MNAKPMCPTCNIEVAPYDPEEHGEFRQTEGEWHYACDGCESLWDASDVMGRERGEVNMPEIIPDSAEPLVLQAILFFTLAKASGEERSAAVQRFVNSKLCRRFGDKLTVANVYGFAEAGGYAAESGAACS